MEFGQFVEKITKEIQYAMGDDVEVSGVETMKNNGILLQGIIIKEKGKNAGPTLYLNDFYNEFLQGKSLDDIISQISFLYENNKLSDNIDVSFFSDYAKVREKIAFKLIHYDNNAAFLKEVPHIKILNLAIVFYYPFEYGGMDNAAITIYNKYMNRWNVTEEDLYEAALVNTPIMMPSRIQHMDDVMKELISFNIENEWQESVDRNLYPQNSEISVKEEWISEIVEQMMDSLKENQEKSSMYVLSNEKRLFGASCLLYPGVLEQFADEAGCSFWILPSSIHEVILIPDKGRDSCDKLKEMVCDVNQSQLSEEEILADSVYYFNKKNKEISLL